MLKRLRTGLEPRNFIHPSRSLAVSGKQLDVVEPSRVSSFISRTSLDLPIYHSTSCVFVGFYGLHGYTATGTRGSTGFPSQMLP